MRTALLTIVSLFLFSACSQKIAQPEISVIFSGNYADPTIVNVDGDYYMTHSSFNQYPGLLVWHSKDLKTWKPVTRALNTIVGNVWAPEIIHHKDKFYIYFPTDIGGNYVITADKAEGPWSEPVKLDVAGIDPGHITDSSGTRYLYVNGGRVARLSDDGMFAETEPQIVYKGWEYPKDWAVECFCLESPKLTYKDGYYYMVSAQGGTSGPSTSHMAVVARSRSVNGPWEDSPKNPLVHTFSPSEPWASKGHATLFEADNGQWYIVYHAYDAENRPLGRATLLETIRWTEDGWPDVNTHGARAEQYVHYGDNNRVKSDDFSKPELDFQWSFVGLKAMDDYALNNCAITLKSDGDLRALLAMPSERDFEVTAKITTQGDVKTGLVLFYNENQYTGIGLYNDKAYGLSKGAPAWGEVDAKGCKYLKLRNDHYTVSVAYSNDGQNWTPYHAGFDVSGFHSNVIPGFASMNIGIIGQGEGSVIIDDFTYTAL